MDVDGEREPGVVPASWWVNGWLMMGMSAEEQVSVEVGEALLGFIFGRRVSPSNHWAFLWQTTGCIFLLLGTE